MNLNDDLNEQEVIDRLTQSLGLLNKDLETFHYGCVSRMDRLDNKYKN